MSSFKDRLTPSQVQEVLDALKLPWRDYYNPGNDGWVNIPPHAHYYAFDSDLSVNINHGGYVDQYFNGLSDEYDLPPKGDIVRLVSILNEWFGQHTKAIRWIKNTLGMTNNRSEVHILHVDDAERYGVKAALILQNLRIWLDSNLAKNHNIKNGRVWSYNTYEAFTEYHPYLSARQIRYQLNKLEDAGIIITGCFNKRGYDKTKWYSVNEPKYAVSSNLGESTKTAEVHWQKCQLG